MKAYITKADFLGLDAYRFGAGDYEALIVPEVGANILELKYKGCNLLRNTSGLTREAFVGRPQVYGIPVLFTPNRISGGRFNYNGREYNFPITDKIHNNHLHGFLHKRPWRISKSEASENAVVIEAVFNCGPDTDFYVNFPHEFEFVYGIKLSDEGLFSDIKIRNLSKEKMPMGLGFHTAFNVRFDKCGEAVSSVEESDYLITASVGKRWELNEATLPTGKFIEPDTVLNELRSGGTRALGQELGAYHFQNEPVIRDGKDFNGARLTNIKTGVSLVYEWGPKFRHSIIWNLDGKSGFICPEPQTWIIDAPNMDMPDDISGFIALEPGALWTDYTRIYVDEGSLGNA